MIKDGLDHRRKWLSRGSSISLRRERRKEEWERW